MGGPWASAHPSTDPYYLKEGGGVSRAERGPFLGSFLLSVRRDESAFGWNCPKRLQSGSWGAKPQPLERRGRPRGLASMLPRWGAGSGAAWHAHLSTLTPAAVPEKAAMQTTVWRTARPHLPGCCVSTSLRQPCQHRQKVKKMDSEHWGLNAGLHAALLVPSTAHTLTHKQFFPGPFENELQMS